MKNWASDAILGASRRETLIRAVLALVVLGAVFWLLPIRRPGEDGGHHGPTPALDPFEKAGVVELKEGQPAPAFTLGTLDGGRASLTDHRDKLVVLNFWATWCQPCVLEMPSLEALWQRYRARGLVVVGVSVDRGSPRSLLEPYVRNLKLTFPILLDPDSKTSNGWRVTALPATFIVRPGGDVTGMAVGAREWNSAAMQALIERLLPGAHVHQ
ncbi:MAG: thiol-disulfide oxidoreductase [Candidatus Rokuibacteriota bacterium]|nr:MAG: thiol-disulfide oxidoreductase [Candidatus Rokubacteria bacterium]PYO10220.1 MAG: thiol-disulfide oxidoreductase [Candidatus Rokubacteria bacterium]